MELLVGKIKIILSLALCDTLKNYVQYDEQPESGGILLGKYLPEENKYLITEASTPAIVDKRGKYFFLRKRTSAQRLINKRWNESAGVINYLGEWHTHRCDFPTPSETDRNLIRMIYSDHSNVWPNIIMIILGRKSCYIGVSGGDSRGEIISYANIEGDDYALLFNR